MSAAQRGPSHHRDDVEPYPSPWRGGSTTRNLPLTSIQGTRLAMLAVEQRCALDAVIDRTGPTPCTEDPEAWFATSDDGVERAEDACVERCEAFVQCGAYADAIETRRLVGVWGGRARGAQITDTDDTEEEWSS